MTGVQTCALPISDGVRGVAGADLTCELAMKIGRGAAAVLTGSTGHRPRILIGKDTRQSGDMLEAALTAGLCSVGADVESLGVLPTPAVAYLVGKYNADAGIVISASHNPMEFNGIKIFAGTGYKLPDEVENQIEAYIDDGTPKIPFATREDIGRTVDFAAGRNRYIGHLISIPTKSFKNMRVGLDCSNGSASSVAKSVFDAIGAKTYVIHNEPDGTNINRGCGSTHIEELQKYVREKHLDVGFAYDGDADRCIAVDELGNVVDGDLIMYVCGKYLKEKGQLNGDTIVTTIMSNLGLYKACDRAGIRYEKTAVGDKYVCENMMANGYSLGGEQSGHIIFSKHATTGDGILTSLMVMEVLIDKKLPLSTLTAEVVIYPQLLKNVRVANKAAAKANPAVQKAVEDVAEALGDDGRILVRESGTEPVIRVMVEAPDDATCAKYVDQVVSVMHKEGLVTE